MKYRAFTREGPGLLAALVTDVQLCDKNLENNPDASKTYKAVWDTGADSTVVSHKVIRELKIENNIVDRVLVRGVNSHGYQNVYVIQKFILPNQVRIKNIEVICRESLFIPFGKNRDSLSAGCTSHI